MSKNPKKSNSAIITVLVILIVIMIAATGFLIYLCIDMVNDDAQPTKPGSSIVLLPTSGSDTPQVQETQPPETTQPQPEHVIATATISSQGDLLMHQPVFESARQSDASFNFESVFRYVKDTVSGYDYALANLETTFGGPDHPHQPNQAFSCPDALADGAKEAGYDMLLTCNNHSGDAMGDGLTRTIEVSREAGLDTLGAQLPGEKRYTILDVNGIKIGMVAYTWAFSGDGSKFSLNGLTAIKDEGQMNYFTKANPDKLYQEAEQIMAEMKAEGAEATIMQIHWGEEYQIQENALQNKMAQKLCDLGFDVVIGGHPHVVQPMELLTSTVDPEHKTVCLYSLGNAVSNQRVGISPLFPAEGYTEDGVLLAVTFEKYSDGSVYLAGTEAIPTWVNMHSNQGKKEYNILPLSKEQEDKWKDLFQLTDNNFTSCQKSYSRTMSIIGQGLTDCQNWLAESKEARESYYLDLVMNPEKYATEETVPLETATETTAETLPAAA